MRSIEYRLTGVSEAVSGAVDTVLTCCSVDNVGSFRYDDAVNTVIDTRIDQLATAAAAVAGVVIRSLQHSAHTRLQHVRSTHATTSLTVHENKRK